MRELQATRAWQQPARLNGHSPWLRGLLCSRPLLSPRRTPFLRLLYPFTSWPGGSALPLGVRHRHARLAAATMFRGRRTASGFGFRRPSTPSSIPYATSFPTGQATTAPPSALSAPYSRLSLLIHSLTRPGPIVTRHTLLATGETRKT
ncbi:MAG: hypothetical protein KA314_13585 [Chloroflexi bacterium]|nr:hypothetical protein [Chloroflexota bacterium]